MIISKIKIMQIFLVVAFILCANVSPVLVNEAAAQAGSILISPSSDNNFKGISNFGKLISSGIQIAMLLAGILTFVFLIWGGIQWISSGGDKAAYESARNRITAALVGLAIVAASWALMAIIEKFFGISVLNTTLNIPTAAGV